jgi:hypothetical protein
VPGVDEQGSPHHDLLRDADDLGGMPVVVADLHLALPAVLAAARAAVVSELVNMGSTIGCAEVSLAWQ